MMVHHQRLRPTPKSDNYVTVFLLQETCSGKSSFLEDVGDSIM